MSKPASDAEYLLDRLGDLSLYLTTIKESDENCFEKPLDIMTKAMGFDISVLYRILNVIEDDLIVEVVKLFDPEWIREDLTEGARLCLSISNPKSIYINEVKAFLEKGTASSNVPGIGCDMVGYIYLPQSQGGGYLFGGDYYGEESRVKEYEVRTCEIMCNLLSSILMKVQFEHFAIYDSLSGLYNSRAIKNELERVFSRFQRKKEINTTIVLCDIDFFKRVNDTYGHIQGDMVLSEIGEIFSATIRKNFDLVGRYGGEEFLLIFEGADETKTFKIIERLRKRIEKHPFKRVETDSDCLEDRHINVTMSFGISCFAKDSQSESINNALSRADAALYESKKKGRNRVTVGKQI